MSDLELPPRRGTYRLGVYGGMFDPPHRGHLAVADAATRACGLDRVLVVPTGRAPHRAAAVLDGRTRLDLCVQAFADIEHVAVSDIELDRAAAGETTWTVETVEELVGQPAEIGLDGLEVAPTLVIGDDQLAAFATWHRWRDLLALAELAVIPRSLPRADVQSIAGGFASAGGRITVVPMVPVDVSSTMVREAAARGDRAAVAEMVPGAIVDDVLELYAGGGSRD